MVVTKSLPWAANMQIGSKLFLLLVFEHIYWLPKLYITQVRNSLGISVQMRLF